MARLQAHERDLLLQRATLEVENGRLKAKMVRFAQLPQRR
jgi:hypothetical protein